MQFSTSVPTLAIALVPSIVAAACGKSDPGGPTATVSGVVRAASGAVIEGASVKIGSATGTTGADGRFELPGKAEYRAAIVFLPGLRPSAPEPSSLERGHNYLVGTEWLA